MINFILTFNDDNVSIFTIATTALLIGDYIYMINRERKRKNKYALIKKKIN